MGWSIPRTWVVAEVVTAAIMNTHVRDNLNQLAHFFGFPYTAMGLVRDGNVAVSAANRCHYYRVAAGGTHDTASGKYVIRVGTSSGNISMATYTSTGLGRAALPNSRLITTTGIACPAAGDATVNTGGDSSMLAWGERWFALSVDNTTATFGAASTTADCITGVASGAVAYQDTAHPAPATAAASAPDANTRSFIIAGEPT